MLLVSISPLSIESLQLELVKYGAIPIFYSCLKSFITKDSEMAKIILEALSGLAMNGACTLVVPSSFYILRYLFCTKYYVGMAEMKFHDQSLAQLVLSLYLIVHTISS